VAVRGTKPKDETRKVTRVPLTQGWIEIPDIPYNGARPVLKFGKGRVSQATQQWWEAVSTMPHCILWTATDWQFALDTARLHAAFVCGEMARASEIRVREKLLGTTFDARRDLRIRYVNPLAGLSVEDEDGDAKQDRQVRKGLDRVADFEARRRRRLLESD
jgi:hypothetical protein